MLATHLIVKGGPNGRPLEGSTMHSMIDRPLYNRPLSAFARTSGVARASLGFLDAVLLWPFRALENRRLLDGMSVLSDHELRDIGLTRQDLRDATALPADRDPGQFFAVRAANRRGF